jgi:hypothetical protein
MKPHPSQVIPFGFATITEAESPATSKAPFKNDGLLEETSFKIASALPVSVNLGFIVTPPATLVMTNPSEAFLCNTAPKLSTSNLV